MTTELTFPNGTFRPNPGRGRLLSMLLMQARVEAALAFRNGEQTLLTLLIPLVLLVGLTHLRITSFQVNGINDVAPRVLALAVMSSAFTGQAIALGFDRRYGVVKRLAATAIPRWLIGAGRLLATCVVVAVQLVIIGGVGFLLGWSPDISGFGLAIVLLLLGTVSFSALGVLLGGALRAEIVLAIANLVWLLLLLVGGIVVPLNALPKWLAEIAGFLPSGALAESLHTTLTTGALPGWQPIIVLILWGLVGSGLAVKTTRLA